MLGADLQRHDKYGFAFSRNRQRDALRTGGSSRAQIHGGGAAPPSGAQLHQYFGTAQLRIRLWPTQLGVCRPPPPDHGRHRARRVPLRDERHRFSCDQARRGGECRHRAQLRRGGCGRNRARRPCGAAGQLPADAARHLLYAPDQCSGPSDRRWLASRTHERPAQIPDAARERRNKLRPKAPIRQSQVSYTIW